MEALVGDVNVKGSLGFHDWDSGVPDPESIKEGEKQAHSPRHQKSRLWPLQISAWKSPMG